MHGTQSAVPKDEDSGTKALDDLHSAFIRSVQHELRTPLSIIQGYVELLHAGDLGWLAPEQQRALLLIVNHVHELRTLVDRINTLLAVEAHATASLPLTLYGVVAEVVEERRTAATEGGLALETYLESALPPLLGDPYQIQQAVDCLLENAIRFTPSGGQVELRLWAESGWVCLEVADNGIGMTEEEAECLRITRFFQADSSYTRRYRGIGLGLTLVRAVVEEHGGRFAFESQPGQGSRFIVKFPVSTSTTQVEPPTEEGLAARQVLVVDDEVLVAVTLQEALKKLPNCEVAVATSGEQALRLLDGQSFDLVITDYKMPGTDGMTLATRVRELHPRTVIIMITAYGDHELRKRAAIASIRRILDKPVSLREIRQVALEAFDQSGDS
jgi:CheY-like chemotaxis protein